jgi:hypothetical protein
MDKKKLIVIAIFVLIVILGISTGYLLTSNKTPKVSTTQQTTVNGIGQAGEAAGTSDEKGDTASGVVEKASGKEPGTHKLIRPGGVSQTVNLVSSLVDLDAYVSKKVQVWGVTQKVTGASWFMDVTRLKVIE